MTITVYRQAYSPISYDSDGNVLGIYNQDGTLTYLNGDGTVVGLNGSTPAGQTLVDAASGNTVGAFRFTINPGDDVIAGQRLLNASDPETYVIAAKGNSLKVVSSSPITKFHGVGISSSTTYTSAAYVIGSAETDLSDATANDLRIDFDEADNVRELIVSWIAGSTSQTGYIHVLGVSYP